MGAPSQNAKPLPGPKGRLRNTMRRMADQVEFMRGLHERYGVVAGFELPGLRCCAVFCPDLARRVVRSGETYPRAYPPALRELMGDCLLLTNGEDHRRRRELVTSALDGEMMSQQSRIAVRRASKITSRWRLATSLRIREEFERYVMSCTLDMVLGTSSTVPTELGVGALKKLRRDQVSVGSPLGGLLAEAPWRNTSRTRRVEQEFGDGVRRSISEARSAERTCPAMASHLARAEGSEDGSPWSSEEQLHDEIAMLALGSPDSPIGALTCAVHYLDRYPEVRDRVEAEVDRELGGRQLSVDDLDRLTFTRALFRETLRLSPPAPNLFPRAAKRDAVLGGYRIPSGTVVFINVAVIQESDAHWDRPRDFAPDRWLEEESGENPAFIPFGLEPTVCPFAEFGETLFVAMIACIAQRLRLRPVSNQHPRRAHAALLGVRGPVPVTVDRRDAHG